jgi:hypothetical protein
MTETVKVNPADLLRVLLALPERLAALEQAVRDLALRLESNERSTNHTWGCVPRGVGKTGLARLLSLLPSAEAGEIPRHELAALAGYSPGYTHSLLAFLLSTGQAERARKGAAFLYWRTNKPSPSGESDERSVRGVRW